MSDILLELDADEIRKYINKVVNRTKEIDFTWDWPCGVAFYGMCSAWEALEDDSIIEYLSNWVDKYLEIGLPPFVVNTVSMGHTLIILHDATGDERYLKIAVEKAEYLQKKALRFGDGVLQHTVSENVDLPGQAWADTLFMAALFLLRLGRKVDNNDYISDALKQFTAHEELLQDLQSNLFYHGYDDGSKSHMSGVFWARANAWAAYTMGEALHYINYLYPEFMAIDGALRDQMSTLVRLQSSNGLWHTVLDNPESYEEVSATAGIAAALVRYGHPLHRENVVKAYKGIILNIDEDGSVRNVSAGTGVMKTPEDYNLVPKKRIQGWGQGLALTFLSNLIVYRKKSEKS